MEATKVKEAEELKQLISFQLGRRSTAWSCCA